MHAFLAATGVLVLRAIYGYQLFTNGFALTLGFRAAELLSREFLVHLEFHRDGPPLIATLRKHAVDSPGHMHPHQLWPASRPVSIRPGAWEVSPRLGRALALTATDYSDDG